MIPILACIALTGLPGADPPFLRGDADGSGHIGIADPILVLQYAFQGGMSPIGCLDAADADDDGAIDLTDAILLLGHLFQGGARPPRPYPCYGADPTDDVLDCQIVPATGEVCIVFCCDRSCSMEGAKWKWLQNHVVRTVLDFDPETQFAILFFSETVSQFPASGGPVFATEAMKAAALSTIMSTPTSHSTCPRPALLASIDIAEKASRRPTKIVYISDGRTTCNSDEAEYAARTLAEVKAKNVNGIPIDTFCLGPDDCSSNHEFMQALAEQSGGEYTHRVQ
jgi:hypothetical protein